MREVQGRLSIVLMEQGQRAKAESIQLDLSSSKHNYLYLLKSSLSPPPKKWPWWIILVPGSTQCQHWVPVKIKERGQAREGFSSVHVLTGPDSPLLHLLHTQQHLNEETASSERMRGSRKQPLSGPELRCSESKSGIQLRSFSPPGAGQMWETDHRKMPTKRIVLGEL